MSELIDTEETIDCTKNFCIFYSIILQCSHKQSLVEGKPKCGGFSFLPFYFPLLCMQYSWHEVHNLLRRQKQRRHPTTSIQPLQTTVSFILGWQSRFELFLAKGGWNAGLSHIIQVVKSLSISLKDLMFPGYIKLLGWTWSMLLLC